MPPISFTLEGITIDSLPGGSSFVLLCVDFFDLADSSKSVGQFLWFNGGKPILTPFQTPGLIAKGGTINPMITDPSLGTILIRIMLIANPAAVPGLPIRSGDTILIKKLIAVNPSNLAKFGPAKSILSLASDNSPNDSLGSLRIELSAGPTKLVRFVPEKFRLPHDWFGGPVFARLRSSTTPSIWEWSNGGQPLSRDRDQYDLRPDTATYRFSSTLAELPEKLWVELHFTDDGGRAVMLESDPAWRQGLDLVENLEFRFPASNAALTGIAYNLGATPRPRILAVEVTQGLQYLRSHEGRPNNSLPLVSDRPGMIRVYLDAGTADGGSRVITRASASIGGRPLPIPSFKHDPIVVKSGAATNTRRMDASLNLLVPPDFFPNRNGVEIQVEVEVGGMVVRDSATVEVKEGFRPKVQLLPISHRGGGSIAPSDCRSIDALNRIFRMYPASGAAFQLHRPAAFERDDLAWDEDADKRPSLQPTTTDLALLVQNRMSEDSRWIGDACMGLLHTSVDDIQGFGFVTAAWASIGPRPLDPPPGAPPRGCLEEPPPWVGTAAHELGHCYEYLHNKGCDAGDGEVRQMSGAELLGSKGLYRGAGVSAVDVLAQQIPPLWAPTATDYGEIMQYCKDVALTYSGRWFSGDRWENLRNWFDRNRIFIT